MSNLRKPKKAFIVASLFIGLLAFTPNLFSDTNAVPATNNTNILNNQVKALIKSTLPNVIVGIAVLDAKSGKVIYEKHSQQAFPPASTTKLFTAAAALLALGPDYQYQTNVKVNPAQLKTGILNGDITIQFSGDPTFTVDNLQQLIKAIKAYGINTVKGNIIIDHSRFQEPYYSLGWSADSLNWYFAPPITSIVINQNKAKLILNANKPVGNAVDASLAPDEAIKLKLTSNIKAVTVDDAKTRCQIKVEMNGQNDLSLGGCWPVDTNPNAIQVAIKNPQALAEKLVTAAFVTEKIILSGKILFNQNSNSAKGLTTIASQTSPALKDLLKPLLLDSNNLYAESLTKTMAAEKYQLGTFQMGVQTIKETLAVPTGIDFSKMKLFDGSGLSRYNLITPQQFAQLLLAMYQDKKVGPIFRDSLAIAGESGTLKAKYTESIKGKLRAKTGSLMGVSALAGYLRSNGSDDDKILVIMIDHALEDSKIRELEQGLTELFLKVAQ